MSQLYTPRPHQRLGTRFLREHARCNLFATPGAGKTSMVYSLLSVLRLAGSAYFPALVIAPKAVCELTWPAEALKWTQFNDLRIVQLLGNERMRQDGILSWGDVYVINYENIPWLVQQYAGKPWPFRIVVADECFPAGTSIKIPGGEKPIEQLRVGDTVLSHEGPQRVEYLLTREVESFSLVSLKLSNGKTIRATKEHPFCTDLGWLPAKHCAGRRLYGMADLPNMPRGVSAAVRESGGSNAQRAYSILHEELSHQGDVQREPFFERGQRAFHAEAAKRAFGRLVMEQGKSLEPGAPRSDVSASASSRPGSYKTGWQRSRHEPDRSADCAAFAARLLMELDRAVGGRGAELSLALQAGLWKPDDKNVLGGGWKLPPYRARANARRKENCEVTVLGVEGVSNQERGRMELVYNLGVANAATYFAGGVLVHNCTRLKGFRSKQGTKRAKALSTIAQHTGRWINLTGTPAPNGYQDLWGQQWFIDFGQRLGDSYSKYMQRWFVENPYSHQVELRHPDCQKEIDRILGDCTLSIRAEDWMQVGKANYIEREVRLPQQAMALYKQMERDFWIEIQQLEARHEVTAVNAAALSQKLLQIASGTVIHDGKVATHVHDAKIEALRSIAEELQEPLLVAYWYKAEESLLKKAFPEFRIFKSQQDEQDWNSGKIKLMGVHPQSAGHGVNLQYGGRAMVHFTHTWNAELREQVEARIGPVRQQAAGFNRAVVHYNLIAAGTLDRDVLDRVAGKISLQEALLRAHARMEEGY